MEVVIFCGVQGSGKTSFYRQRFFDTHVRLSLDLLKTRNREDVLLHACLAVQQPVVVDNTNPTKKARARYAELAKASGMRAVLYFFEAALDDALLRNASREEQFRVPDLAVRGTFAKLEVPTREESFDAAYRVVLGDSQFVVEDL